MSDPTTLAGGLGGAAPRRASSAPVDLCELLDRVLNTGVVIRGEVTISVADVELVYLGLNLLLASSQSLGRGGEGTT